MPEFVKIGNLYLGKDFPVRVQSMLNTDTSNTLACINQSIELAEAGCEMIRLSTRNIKDAENLYNIKNELYRRNIEIPIIADIHFNPVIAETAAQIADKIRINPGNYIDKNLSKEIFTEKDDEIAIEKATEALFRLTEICKHNNTVIRVGSNQGSLSERIVYRFGDTAKGMVESVKEFIEIFNKLDFDNLVISLKSSNPLIMIEANRLFVDEIIRQDKYFPIHLGVTEAGSGMEGRVKSAIGIGILLSEGIGDTIRVSLSENPVNEIIPAKEIVNYYPKRLKLRTSFETILGIKNSESKLQHIKLTDNFERIKLKSSTEKFTIIGKDISEEEIDEKVIIADISDKNLKESCNILNDISSEETKIPIIIKYLRSEYSVIDVSIDLGYLLLNYPVSGIITNIYEELLADILQTTKLRLSKPEYISCPTCARTEYDLVSVLEDIKGKTKHLKNISIAVMGCVVNGPGEMRGADIGVLGCGKGKVVLYINGKRVGEPFRAEEAGERLIKELRIKN